MKIERVSQHIWSLKAWMFIIPVHVWVVVEDDGVTLVDTGYGGMGKGILEFIEQLNAGPLKRILLTHGHSDHVGSVDRILERTRVPVYAHRIEIPYINGELPYPRRKKTESGKLRGLVQPLEEDGNGKLSVVAGLEPHLTPGHAPGHVVYYHLKDQVLLAGDLFTSKRGRLHNPIPMFTADMAEAVRSSFILHDLAPKRVEVCHGNPVFEPENHLAAYIESTVVRQRLPREVLEQANAYMVGRS